MGVHGLWELLAPVGRRVSVETLAGKRLAIDASIWMVQFMKAMRDENGEMVRNAHILGFFRRICKLLFLRTKPVFVFDGGTPALKRRTVIARRRHRENAQAKIRKTAEKLLLNQFKQMKLKELAEELERQKTNNEAKGKKVFTGEEVEKLSKSSDCDDKEFVTDEAVTTPKISGGNVLDSGRYNQKELDEMLAASLLTEEEGFIAGESSFGAHVHDLDEDAYEDEEMILPAMHAKVDPAVLASLPPSMQLDLLVQMRERLMAENRQKYQKVKKVPSRFSELQIESYLKTVAFRREIGEVQKSAAGRGIGGVQTSRIASEANREFIFSSSYSGDKEVLSSAGLGRGNSDHISVPMAKSSKDIVNNGALGIGETASVSTEVEPLTEALRKGKTASVSTEVEPLMEALRKGKTASVSTEVEPLMEALRKGKTASVSTEVEPLMEALRKGKTASVSTDVEPPLEHENDVETYLDERGRVRVSRVRAMGIRMTRDLQRNLDLMKEMEEERAPTSNVVHTDPSVVPNAVAPSGKAAEVLQLVENSVLDTDELASGDNKNGEALLTAGTSLEISFENNGQHELGDDDDDLFASLVAGEPVLGFSADDSSSKKQVLNYASDLEWEEGNTLSNDIEVDSRPPSTDEGMMEEKELEWEEGSFDLFKRDSSYVTTDCKENVSKGSMEEEADFQEAIRRSLQDVKAQKSENASCAGVQCREIGQRAFESTNAQFLHQEDLTNLEDQLRADSQVVESPCQVKQTARRLDTMSNTCILHAHDPLEIQSAPSLGGSFGETEVVSEEGCHSSSKLDLPVQSKSALWSLDAETPIVSVASKKEKSAYNSNNLLMDNTCCKDDGFASSSNSPPNTDLVSEQLTNDLSPPNSDAAVDGSGKTAVMGPPSVGNAINEIDFGKESASEGCSIHISTEREEPCGNFDYLGGQEEQNKVVKTRLEEEMLMLGQEQLDLGDEQKKLERNAESVSSEMFAEVQELLQMFGLPYIIAPMEAEAQCAYLELNNLVDGVVTDDSDAFLFGAHNVYKNIFDNRKYVETYFMKDIESELGLNREKLIRTALLLGSDYTEGISGIGIVNAIEVVNAFPEEDGLHKFREWIESPDPSILGKFEMQAGGGPRKRASKVGDGDMCYSDNKEVGVSSSAENIAGSSDENQSVKQTFMAKHRNVSKNWHMPYSFPSDAVISAYASPQVDKETEPFSWGKPDLLVLRKLCWERFSWSTQKSNELLLPVLKEYDKRETQLRLEAFYTFNERFAKIRSKRIKTAVKGIAGTKSLSLMDESVKDGRGSKKGKRVNQGNAEVDGSNETSQRRKVQDAQLDGNSIETVNENKLKRSRGRSSHSIGSRRGGLEFGGRDKSRGRGRGRGTKQSDSSDESSAGSGQELQGGYEEQQHQVRRSKRTRKEVKYSMDDSKDSESAEETNHSGDEHGDLPVTEDLDTVPAQTNNAEIDKHESSPVFPEKDSSFSIDACGSGTREFQFSSSKTDIFPSDIHPSSDYLTMGGGFCADDDEEVKDPIGETSSSDLEMTFDPSHGVCSSFVEDESDIIDQAQSNVCPAESTGKMDVSDSKQSPEKTINESELENNEIAEKSTCIDDSVRSLRALPNLRRKRRKS